VANRPIYVALAVTCDGRRDILGLWAGEGGEGAKHRLAVLTELKKPRRQRRAHRRLRRPVGVARGDRADLAADDHPDLCGASVAQQLPLRRAPALGRHCQGAAPGLHRPTEAAAMERFLEFVEAWGQRYPAIVRLWENAWSEFVPFLTFDVEIHRVVCSTNAIWVFGSRGRSGRCFPGRRSRRPVPTLNAIDAARLSLIRSVGLAA
jgi:transposase-like protein